MNLQLFKTTLSQNGECGLLFRFASGQTLAPHFHITEVGKAIKEFVDCGGTRRSTEACVLQTLVANDTDHRLKSGKLLGVLEKASVLELQDSVPVELEVQTDTISIYEVTGSQSDGDNLVFELSPKSTACLAPEVCGLEILAADAGDCDSSSGCC